MERLGGFFSLFGLAALAFAAYGWFAGIAVAPEAGLAGLVLLASGYYLSSRRPDKPGALAVPPASGPPAFDPPQAETAVAHVEDRKAPEAVFSVVQTGDDDILTKVEALLEKDPRITAIVSESGQWYQNPDRDDLPEWHALRAYCSRDLVKQIMEESEARVRSALGERMAAEVSFSRFS